MGFIDIFKKKPTIVKITETPKEPKPKKEKVVEKSAKEIADEKGEPWVNVTSVELDPENIGNGAFELDWNDKFILNLIKAGYKMKDDDTDNIIADRWFQDVCRNIALEMYEQVQADPTNRDVRNVRQRNLGGGRTEVS